MTKKRDTWRGHTVYRCTTCAYSTLHQDKLTDHEAKAHPTPRTAPKASEPEGKQESPKGDNTKGNE